MTGLGVLGALGYNKGVLMGFCRKEEVYGMMGERVAVLEDEVGILLL